ncbi:MAG: vWA domain-containing protein [Chitinophagales bacterium]
MNEWYSVLEALEQGLAGSSLTGFYHLCRAVLVKSETHYDRFDLAFSEYFYGIETPEELPETIWEWLDKNLPPLFIDPEMRKNFKEMDLETLKNMLEERLKEQTEEHHGGNYWVGTGGTSPFGHSGFHPGGIRIGGQSQHQSAVKVAAERRYQDFRTDSALDTRQFQMALRRLRCFTSRLEGAKTELDIDGTIEATGKNAGHLQLVWERPRENSIRLLLLMDSGGSMTSYVRLCSRLFQAVNQVSHFKDLQIMFFHNCIYDYIYLDPYCHTSNCVETKHVLRNLDGEYRVILVGDASMAPSELTHKGGVIEWGQYNEEPGMVWMRRLKQHFEHSVWLNPMPKRHWDSAYGNQTIKMLSAVYPMFELSVDGLDMAVKKLRAIK